ncbi:MAG TPA: KpsF/GutQ family sugar-phosphate isomerase [Aquificaceae bacterium]|nr:KpsF/GutQ family sugar-phosphate isomerase [Aquificaceae bacterium]HIQ30828.1 KpsF/GutQ family sugar-phosphate isomerase [Aquifex aeolicus]
MNAEEILAKGRRVIEKEIEGLEELKKNLGESFVKAIKLLLRCEGKVILTGIGKSGHVARKIASTLASTGTPAHFLHPSEALHGDLGVIDKGDVVVAISNSGESSEILALVPYVKMLGIPLIAITNRENSTLSKYSDIHLHLGIKEEACPLRLAPTTSSTATLVLGDALAMTLLELRGFTERDFALRHPAGALGRRLRLVRDLYHTGEELPVVKEDTPMKEVVIEISSKGFGATAVIDGEGYLTGIITDGDLRRFVKKGGSFEDSVARDVMTKNPKVAKPDEMALEALRRMEEFRITVLIVVDEKNRPVGIIHLHDILRAEINL